MPTINTLDLGPFGLTAGPSSGQVGRSVVIEGSREVSWGGGARARTREMVIEVQAQTAIGGQALATNQREANRYLVQQLVELAGNGDLSPAYVQWRTGGGITIFDPQDGWWRIDDVEPLDFTWPRTIPVRLRATAVAPAGPLPTSLARSGGQLSTNYTGTGIEISGFPVGSTNQPANAVARTGGEGAIPLSAAPSIAIPGSLPITPPPTIAGLFLGGCRVFDTVTVGGNAVPTGGTFAHATWIEVFAPDHRFEGDCIITNGLLLLLFQAGQTRVCRNYVWSTAQATPGWVQFADLTYEDNAANGGTLRSYSVQRVGLEEVRVVCDASSSGGNWAEITVRLQRGQYFARTDFRPLSQANTSVTGLSLVSANNLKIVTNSSGVVGASGGASDVSGGSVVANTLSISTDYGYSVAFTNAAAQPYIMGLLWQNKPGYSAGQPLISGSTKLGMGDNALPLQNAILSYGFYCIPVGTSTTTTDKLQAEAESGTLTNGVTSVADAVASGGNTAKVTSGGAATGTDTWGTAFQPPAGTYALFVRMKVTSTASGSNTLRVYAFNSTDGTGVGTLSSFAPNVMTTSYLWYLVSTGWTAPAGKNMQVKFDLNGVPPTDYFIDESVFVPLTLSAANSGPQEIWQQFLMDIERELQRAA